jgi:hypothetical protein
MGTGSVDASASSWLRESVVVWSVVLGANVHSGTTAYATWTPPTEALLWYAPNAVQLSELSSVTVVVDG